MSKDVKEVRMSARRVYRTKGIASAEAQRTVGDWYVFGTATRREWLRGGRGRITGGVT